MFLLQTVRFNSVRGIHGLHHFIMGKNLSPFPNVIKSKDLPTFDRNPLAQSISLSTLGKPEFRIHPPTPRYGALSFLFTTFIVVVLLLFILSHLSPLPTSPNSFSIPIKSYERFSIFLDMFDVERAPAFAFSSLTHRSYCMNACAWACTCSRVRFHTLIARKVHCC